MDEPISITTAIWIALIVLFGLIFPQLLGVVGYLRTRNKRKRLKVFALLIAPLTFFIISMFYWIPQAKSIQENSRFIQDPFSVIAVLPTILGTIAHLLLGILIFMTLGLIQYLIGNRHGAAKVFKLKPTAMKDPAE